MTTPAKMALDDFEDCYTWWANGDVATPKASTVETIRAALRVLDEVQSGQLERCRPIRDRANGVYSSGSYKVDLDAVTRIDARFDADGLNCSDVKQFAADWQTVKGHLATGKGGGDLTKCPKCNGPADNGHDRCFPPNPYYCSKCEEQPAAPTQIDAGELEAALADYDCASDAILGKHIDVLAKAARAHLEKSKGGV